jgi:hypothetical protein
MKRKSARGKMPAPEEAMATIATPAIETPSIGTSSLPVVHSPGPFDADDPFAMLGREHGHVARIAFRKGEWIVDGGDGTEVSYNNRRMVACVDKLLTGWTQWIDKRPVTTEFGLVANGYKQRPRQELGDNDSNAWPIGDDGQKSDPWQHSFQLPFVDEDGRSFLWSVSSSGGRQAIGDLSLDYSHYRRHGGKGRPVVELGIDWYKHAQFGRVYKPKLPVLEWTEEIKLDDEII